MTVELLDHLNEPDGKSFFALFKPSNGKSYNVIINRSAGYIANGDDYKSDNSISNEERRALFDIAMKMIRLKYPTMRGLHSDLVYPDDSIKD